MSHLVIIEGEWGMLSLLHKYLKSFKKFSNVLCGDKYPTLPSVVVGVNILLDSLETLCENLDEKPDRNAMDATAILAFQAGRDKLLKHYNKTNWIYCAVLILDPRHKLETFEKTSWGKALKERSLGEFETIFKTKYAHVVEEKDESGELEAEDSDDEYTKQIDALYSSDKSQRRDWKKELQDYLKLKRVDRNVDIMDWWHKNEASFPKLALMARELLAIGASSAASERLFSKAGLVIRKCRNQLSDIHAEMLLCLNSWF